MEANYSQLLSDGINCEPIRGSIDQLEHINEHAKFAKFAKFA